MKTHTDAYKNELVNLGKEIDSKITFSIGGEETELDSQLLCSVNPHYEGAILKSVMKQLDFVSYVQVPIGTEVNYQFGLKVNGSYEYINYGNYIVEKSEKQEDTNTFKTTCYDKMLYAMKDYEEPKSRNLCGLNDKGFIVNQSGVVITNNGYWYCIIDTTNINSLYVSGDYTLLSDDVIRVGGFNEYPILGSQGTRITPRTNTAINTTNYNYVMFCFGAKSGHTIDEIKSSFQIEIGTSGTPYIPSGTPTYPITIRKYLEYLCDDIGLGFANISDTFTNYDQTIATDLFKDLGYTKRDVLDQLAEVTASTICINDDDKLEVRYLNDTKSRNLYNNILPSGIRKYNCSISYNNGKIVLSPSGSDAYVGDIASAGTNWTETRGQLVEVKPNTTYTILITNELLTKNYVSFYNANKTSTQVTRFNSSEYTFTTLSTTKYVSFRIGRQSTSSGQSYEYNVMFNDGDITIDYEPYGADLINEEFIKNTRAEFSEKYGPVNSIVLSRSGESDNVYLRDEESVAENGLTEIKIVDNQIMNDNTRDRFLPGILERLDGLEYYPCDFESIGIAYLDLCDKYNVKVRDKIYPCVMLSDELEVDNGINEIIYTEAPQQTETDYKKADKTDRRINQTTLIVDKQQQTIDAIIGTDSENFSSLTELKLDVDEIDSKVEASYNFSKEATANNIITSEKMQVDGLINLTISGNAISQDFLTLHITNNEQEYLILPIKTLLKSGDVKDELSIESVYNEDEKKYEYHVFLNKKLDYIDGQVVPSTSSTNYLLAEDSQKLMTESNEEILLENYGEGKEDLGIIDLIIDEGEHSFSIQSFNGLDYYLKYAVYNELTSKYATNLTLQSEIKQTEDEIMLKVNEKVDNEEIIASINVAVENDQGVINLVGNSVTIDSDHFHLDEQGNVTANAVQLTGGSIDYVTQMGNVTIGKGQSGLIFMTATQNGIDYQGQYNVGGMGYKRANNWTARVTGSSASGIGDGFKIYYNGTTLGELLTAGNLSNHYGKLSLRNSVGTEKIVCYGDEGAIVCVSVQQTSLESLKKNFEKLNNALEIVKDTDIYKYNFKDDNDEDKKHIGLVIGDNFNYRKEITSKNNNAVDTYSMVSVLWEAVKEQQEQIESLQKEIDILKGGK